jgi:hypothetical protein
MGYTLNHGYYEHLYILSFFHISAVDQTQGLAHARQVHDHSVIPPDLDYR